MELKLFLCLLTVWRFGWSSGQQCLGEWQCDDGTCISKSWRCDGQGDCLDGSDEMDCACEKGEFHCKDGSGCMDASAVCNGKPQCNDGSDKLNCSASQSCLGGEWKCDNRICIPEELLCNGVNDCVDNSDEKNCEMCKETNMRCSSGLCLAADAICDGQAQCPDGRDEPATCGLTCKVSNGACSHNCTDGPRGVVCSCPAGWKISIKGTVCEDIDECLQAFGPCLHFCENTPGSFSCSCATGFQLEQGTVCSAKENDMQILIVREKSLGIVNLQTGEYEVLDSRSHPPLALAYDLVRKSLYWVDDQGDISKAENNSDRVLYSGVKGVHSLAVDWLSGQIYWTNQKTKAIHLGAADGRGYATVLQKNIDPQELVLAPTESTMFWMNKGESSQMSLEAAGMDGSQRRTVAVVTAQAPRSLTMDYAAKRLYWISDYKESVETVKFDGTGRYSFMSFFKRGEMLGLAAFQGLFYWSDGEKIWQMPQSQPQEKQGLLEPSVSLLSVVHELQQPRGYVSPCAQATCTICLPSPDKPVEHLCRCPEGTFLLASGDCEPFKVAYATVNNLHTLEFGKNGVVKRQIMISDENITSFDMDWRKNLVFWTNGIGQLKCTKVEQDQTEYIPTSKRACKVKLDPISGHLYWVSCDRLSIGVIEVPYSAVKSTKQLYEAGNGIIDLYVDWPRGNLYWLKKAQIYKMKLSGGKVVEILDASDYKIDNIVLDLKSNSFICNSDSSGLQILSVLKKKMYSLKGKWEVRGATVAAHEPYLVSLLDHVLTLWDRRQTKSLTTVELESGIIGVVASARDMEQVLKVTKDQLAPTLARVCPRTFEACRDGRDCIHFDHLCDGQKDCADGSDEENCPRCFSPDNFQCTNGSCIEKNLVCDGIKHCPDGIDETNCAPKIKDCTFRCDNGTKCFIRRVQCDGVKDCVDGTDEEKCYMNAGKFRPGAPAIQCQRMSVACWDQLGCVRYDHICDGERDCVDGSDEDDCPRRCTDPDNFECNDGTCIERLLVCDGKPQCADHSDEDRCQKPVMDCVNPCDSGTSCFASSSRCDGRKDCRDGADEDGCPSKDKTTIPPTTPAATTTTTTATTTITPDIPVQTVTCPSTSVPCREGSQCITKDQLCNGKRDCPDGFDEDSCPKKCEDPETFLCKDGLKCIKKALVCDGEPQCPDGSDETTCLVTASACRLRCDYNTKCISEAAYCDGKADCRDGADERNCSSPNGPLVCGLGFKMCRDGKECILYRHLCDGEEDCKDGSDEDSCSKKCETGFFQCAHGKKCIEEKLVCDDIPHCQDDSDEKNCWKPTEICAFRCDNNTNCFPEKFRCDGDFDCLDHTDEMDCAVEECASSEFQCSSGQCISLSLRCDGDADCRDHSDEKNCSKPPHCPTETRCPGSHECLLEEWICDGDVDCKDGSDEKGCQSTAVECSELQWPCKSKKQCIPEYWRCDGERDCYDDSDEAGCGSLKCPDHQFQCGSGECMKTSLVCNGISNCPDGSDEGGNCTTVHCSSSAQCSQICYSTPRGLKCACEVGFKLAEDGLYCEDINECKEISPSICSHKCVNTKGSFTCQCYPGYLLDPNGRSCKAIGEPFLLASIQYELLQYGLRSSSIDVLFSTGKKLVFSLDYDWLEQKLFWVSLDAETIKWTSLDQKQKGTVVKGIKSDCIAVDWVGRNLYWTDGVAGQILAIRMNTTSTKFRNYTVVLDEDLEQPRALVLQPQRGMMFWSEIGSKPQIERAGMDGSDRKVIITKRISWPISLTLDSLGSRIFWTDEKLKCIGSAKLDGTDIKLLQLRETPSPFSVAVFNDMVYWTDTKRRVIQKANKDTGKNRTVLIKRLGQPFGLKIMHENLQGKFPNPCKSLGCSHICLLGPREQAACRCPIGLLLSEDGVSCVTASETAFLFLLSASAVTQIYLKNMHTSVSQKTWPEHKALSTSNLNVMTALDYVVKDQILYLANADQGFVGQYKVKESELVLRSKVLQLQGDAVTALAVDWLTNNLYWSSSRQALLRVTSATGAYTTVLFADNLEGPSSIALHPPSGNMCFADVGKEGRKSLPQIECAYMDGQNRRVLWRKAVMPTSLTFSDQGTELFWADIDSGVIGSVDMDGLKYKAYQTGGGLLTSFARSDYVFFWTTFNDTTKMWYSDGQQPRQLWFEVKTTVLNLKVYSKFSQNGSGGCATQNGGCSHLCLPFPGGQTCRCAQDYRLSNDTDCVKDLQCPPDTKPCRDGRKCLASAKWCDRRTDCLDHSDEANCSYITKVISGQKPKGGSPKSSNPVVKVTKKPPTPPTSRGSDMLPSTTQMADNEILVRKLDAQPCDDELCNKVGKCILVNDKPSCDCLLGYKGEFCQDKVFESLRVQMTLGVIAFLMGLVIFAVLFVFLRKRVAKRKAQEKAGETALMNIENTEEASGQTIENSEEASGQTFPNETYDPEEELVSPLEK